MSLMQIPSGSNIPYEINVVIEIPMHSDPVKYEVDKHTGVLMVDRFMATAMHYPANYGYIPNTLSEDGDPVDVLVLTPFPLVHGSVIACRPIGMLKMMDEAGNDAKLLAVPTSKLTKLYETVKTYQDLPATFLDSLAHFFKHYKDLEEGKWVKIEGWEGPAQAQEEIVASQKRAEQS